MARSDRRHKSPQRRSPEESVVMAIGQIFVGIWRLIRGKKNSKQIDPAVLAQIHKQWQQVIIHMSRSETAALAVTEADKLLDAALQANQVPGSTLGERLKGAQSRFKPELYNQIWQAHKLRNTLAHEVGATVTSFEAQQAVVVFREALEQLGIF